MNRLSRLIFSLMIFVLAMSAPAPTFSMQGRGQAPPPLAPPNPNGPLYRAKGEQYRVYEFPGTNESIPYRLFVPSRWTPDTRLPVLVTLRAGNSVNNSYRSNNDFVKQAEQRGYIVVTPMGYRPLSQPYYGSKYPVLRAAGPSTPMAGWTEVEDQRAEQDVLNVLEILRQEYNIDTTRVFVHGQNPSGSGALHLAAKYPEKFRGMIISAAPIDFAKYPVDNVKGKVSMLVVHGDADASNIAASKTMADAAKAAGVNTEYIVVPGGTHLEAYLTAAPGIFDWLDKQR